MLVPQSLTASGDVVKHHHLPTVLYITYCVNRMHVSRVIRWLRLHIPATLHTLLVRAAVRLYFATGGVASENGVMSCKNGTEFIWARFSSALYVV